MTMYEFKKTLFQRLNEAHGIAYRNQYVMLNHATEVTVQPINNRRIIRVTHTFGKDSVINVSADAKIVFLSGNQELLISEPRVESEDSGESEEYEEQPVEE